MTSNKVAPDPTTLPPENGASEKEDKESPKVKVKKYISCYWKYGYNIIVFVSLLPLLFIFPDKEKESRICRAAFVFLLTILYWLPETLPLAVTAFFPGCLYPILGILDSRDAVYPYLNDSVLILFGGMFLASGFEFSNLHKRIALKTINVIGSSTARLLLGLMLVTCFLSGWMSNTAVAAMMAPMVLAIMDELEQCLRGQFEIKAPTRTPAQKNKLDRRVTFNEKITLTRMKEVNLYKQSQVDIRTNDDDPEQRLGNFIYKYKLMLMLAVEYSSNLGGIGLITGSGTNLVALELIRSRVNPADDGPKADLTFLSWTLHNYPPMILIMVFAYLLLLFACTDIISKHCRKKGKDGGFKLDKETNERVAISLKEAYAKLGPMSTHEIAISVLFTVVVFVWLFQDPQLFPGWADLFPRKAVTLTTPVIAANILMFIIPRNKEFYSALGSCRYGEAYFLALMQWRYIHSKFPWGLVLILGGGFSLSKGFQVSGLGQFIGDSLGFLKSVPKEGSLLFLLYFICFLTNGASNTAVASIFVPILLNMSRNFGIHPLYFTLSAASASSFSFMLPIATPPNAIVYTAGRLKLWDMIRIGFALNMIAPLIYWGSTITLGSYIFNYNSYKLNCLPNNTRLDGTTCDFTGTLTRHGG